MASLAVGQMYQVVEDTNSIATPRGAANAPAAVRTTITPTPTTFLTMIPASALMRAINPLSACMITVTAGENNKKNAGARPTEKGNRPKGRYPYK